MRGGIGEFVALLSTFIVVVIYMVALHITVSASLMLRLRVICDVITFELLCINMWCYITGLGPSSLRLAGRGGVSHAFKHSCKVVIYLIRDLHL